MYRFSYIAYSGARDTVCCLVELIFPHIFIIGLLESPTVYLSSPHLRTCWDVDLDKKKKNPAELIMELTLTETFLFLGICVPEYGNLLIVNEQLTISNPKHTILIIPLKYIDGFFYL